MFLPERPGQDIQTAIEFKGPCIWKHGGHSFVLYGLIIQLPKGGISADASVGGGGDPVGPLSPVLITVEEPPHPTQFTLSFCLSNGAQNQN